MVRIFDSLTPRCDRRSSCVCSRPGTRAMNRAVLILSEFQVISHRCRFVTSSGQQPAHGLPRASDFNGDQRAPRNRFKVTPHQIVNRRFESGSESRVERLKSFSTVFPEASWAVLSKTHRHPWCLLWQRAERIENSNWDLAVTVAVQCAT